MGYLKLVAFAGAALAIVLAVFGGSTRSGSARVALDGAVAVGAVRTADVIRVIDGDTFVISGGARVRVRDFDTPERRRYDCREEKQLAEAATKAAQRILAHRKVRLTVTDRDRYGRIVADVAVLRPNKAPVDFADAMVSRGVGAHWAYGNEPQPTWCPPRRSFFG